MGTLSLCYLNSFRSFCASVLVPLNSLGVRKNRTNQGYFFSALLHLKKQTMKLQPTAFDNIKYLQFYSDKELQSLANFIGIVIEKPIFIS